MHPARSILRLTPLALALVATACDDNDGPSPAATTGNAAPSEGAAPADHTVSLAGEPIRTHHRPDGLTIEVFEDGAGAPLTRGQTGVIDFEMRLADGRVMDSSQRRRASLRVPLVKGSAVPGLLEGLEGMRVGEARRLRIPSALAYADVGRPPIPPRADLVFDVVLVGIAESD